MVLAIHLDHKLRNAGPVLEILSSTGEKTPKKAIKWPKKVGPKNKKGLEILAHITFLQNYRKKSATVAEIQLPDDGRRATPVGYRPIGR